MDDSGSESLYFWIYLHFGVGCGRVRGCRGEVRCVGVWCGSGSHVVLVVQAGEVKILNRVKGS